MSGVIEVKRPRLAKNEYIDENDGYIKKSGFLGWIRNYGYYYKSYLIVAAVIIGFIVALYFSMRAVSPDLRLFYCVAEEPDGDTYQALGDNIYPYLVDVDSDDVIFMEPSVLVLVDDPVTTSQRTAYRNLEKTYDDDEVPCYIVDEYGYEYLMEQGVLRELDFFGINSPEPYRLRLNDTALWNGIPDDREYYLVMKYIEDSHYTDFYVSTITTMVVDMCYDLTGAPTK